MYLQANFRLKIRTQSIQKLGEKRKFYDLTGASYFFNLDQTFIFKTYQN